MWFFRAPEVYFGQDSLSHLAELKGRLAFIVTDRVLASLGFVERVSEQLNVAGIASQLYSDVEPQPSLETVREGAAQMLAAGPDWIIGLGGGSCMDAARAMWILYEHPDIDPASISPLEDIELRQKARLICIPTTAGTGSEAGYAMVLTDNIEKRKLTLATRNATADLAIVDPQFTANLPRGVTVDTGIDVLTHAIEGYTSTWANDFTDGPCLKAIHLVFRYLPRAAKHGAEDLHARERMANAATLAGLALGNSAVALAHALGHSAGALLPQLTHGRVTALFLPYTIEYNMIGVEDLRRYQDISYILGLAADDPRQATRALVRAIRDLQQELELPLSLRDAGISEEAFQERIAGMVERAEFDANLLMGQRIPDVEELEKLFRYAYQGREVDF